MTQIIYEFHIILYQHAFSPVPVQVIRAVCQWFCTVTQLQQRSGPCYDNVPNLALLLKSWINACFKSLTWSATGLTGLP